MNIKFRFGRSSIVAVGFQCCRVLKLCEFQFLWWWIALDWGRDV